MQGKGMQFFEEHLSAQLAGGIGACMAVRGGGPLVLGELTALRPTHPEHFFFSTVHGAFSFWCFKKKMGGVFRQAKPAFRRRFAAHLRTNLVHSLILINI